MPAIDISGCCIPAECDNIKLPYNGEIASRWDAYLLCDICRHFASVMLHFASLITHNLRCIPAYAHQIPTGFFQSLLNYHRDNLYIISNFYGMMSRIFRPHFSSFGWQKWWQQEKQEKTTNIVAFLTFHNLLFSTIFAYKSHTERNEAYA